MSEAVGVLEKVEVLGCLDARALCRLARAAAGPRAAVAAFAPGTAPLGPPLADAVESGDLHAAWCARAAANASDRAGVRR